MTTNHENYCYERNVDRSVEEVISESYQPQEACPICATTGKCLKTLPQDDTNIGSEKMGRLNYFETISDCASMMLPATEDLNIVIFFKLLIMHSLPETLRSAQHSFTMNNSQVLNKPTCA